MTTLLDSDDASGGGATHGNDTRAFWPGSSDYLAAFVLEYIGAFLPAQEIDPSVPEELAETLAENHAQMGVGLYTSIEEQRDVALAAFEALEIDS